MKLSFKIFLTFTLTCITTCVADNIEPSGKYCGEIINNPIDITFSSYNHHANISASIFRQDYSCLDEEYQYDYSSYSIQLPQNQDDCLNEILNKYNLCPCPPESFYNKDSDSVSILNDIIGVIELTKC